MESEAGTTTFNLERVEARITAGAVALSRIPTIVAVTGPCKPDLVVPPTAMEATTTLDVLHAALAHQVPTQQEEQALALAFLQAATNLTLMEPVLVHTSAVQGHTHQDGAAHAILFLLAVTILTLDRARLARTSVELVPTQREERVIVTQFPLAATNRTPEARRHVLMDAHQDNTLPLDRPHAIALNLDAITRSHTLDQAAPMLAPLERTRQDAKARAMEFLQAVTLHTAMPPRHVLMRVELEHTRLEELLGAPIVLLDLTTPTHRTADAMGLLLVRILLELDTQAIFPARVRTTSPILDTRTAFPFHRLATTAFQTATASTPTPIVRLATTASAVPDMHAMERRIKILPHPPAASRHHQTHSTFPKGPLLLIAVHLSSALWDTTALVVIALPALLLERMWMSLAMLQQAARLSCLDIM